MGFEFGVIRHLDFKITLFCFILVVAFVILVEYVLGIMEYFMEGSRLYTKMVKMIYKELMLMGMLTFCVMMYEAVPREEEDIVEKQWLESIDFSQVYLFFVTFFFVMHAFYLMLMSVSAVTEYRLLFSERTSEVVESLESLKSNTIGTALFYMKLVPFSTTRYHAEFSMLQSLFNRLYRLPENLDFPYYLSGCFDRFALRTINRNVFTWVVLLVFVVANFFRIRYNLTQRIFTLLFHTLGLDISIADVENDRHLTTNDTIFMFGACGVLLVVYTIALTMVSRVYKARLVDKVYPNHSDIQDYITLLRAKAYEQDHPNEQVKEMRMSPAVLKKEIELEFDAQEEGEEEDEEGIKYVAKLLQAGWKYLDETYTELVVYLQVRCRQVLCCYSPPAVHTSQTGSMLNAVVAEDLQQHGSSGHSRRGVTEKQVEYVPLKKRLCFTARERAILVDQGHSNVSTERDELLPRSVRSYGTASASVYSNMVDPEHTSSSNYSRQGVVQSSEDDSSSSSCRSGVACAGLCCCNCCSDSRSAAGREGVDLNSIFCAGKPIWYFRAVELQIMFTCMYMALWATNFITLVRGNPEFTLAQSASFQALMLVPIFFALYRTAFIAETCSLILAICDLNIEVLHEVLVNTEEMAALASELRAKIYSKIRSWAREDQPTFDEERLFLHLLFEEIDQDGSGAIDKAEFRVMLRKLNLSYTDHRFNLLFRAVDTIGGDGLVGEEDLVEFMFPSAATSVTDLGEVRRLEQQHGHEHSQHNHTHRHTTTEEEWSQEIQRDIQASRALSPDKSFVGSVTASHFHCLGRPGLQQQ